MINVYKINRKFVGMQNLILPQAELIRVGKYDIQGWNQKNK